MWLKCKVNAKGYTYDVNNNGAYTKQNGSGSAYLYFSSTGVNTYNITVYTNPGTGWQDTYTTTDVTTIVPGENFISDLNLQFVFKDKDFIDTYHTPYIKYDKKGKVTYKGTGEVDFGSVNGGALNYYGYFTISGTSVDKTKLPFNPDPGP